MMRIRIAPDETNRFSHLDMSSFLPLEPLPAAPTSAGAQTAYRGRAVVYVLAAAGPEDLLKVGLTHDPLARWPAFHPRWFEVFDLEHSLLVETESRRDAQALETQLHRMLVAHRCPMPLALRDQAGGGTEWYRGAYAMARRFVEEQQARGYVVHPSATRWLHAAMRQQQDRLEGLLRQAHADHTVGWLSPVQYQALRDLVDAHRCLDPEVSARLPADVLHALGIAA